MSNPWLHVPLADYEAHMSAPQVGQLTVLSDLFAAALAYCKPRSVALLGVAGGNGLEWIDPALTRRVVGLDCNPTYLDVVRVRFGALPGLELHCLDLGEAGVEIVPASLVHAALIFEHAGAERCLDNAVRMVEPGGVLSVVLQLPSAETPAVASTSLASLQRLGDHFRFVDPGRLCAQLSERGLPRVSETCRRLPAGKSFWAGLFRKRA